MHDHLTTRFNGIIGEQKGIAQLIHVVDNPQSEVNMLQTDLSRNLGYVDSLK